MGQLYKGICATDHGLSWFKLSGLPQSQWGSTDLPPFDIWYDTYGKNITRRLAIYSKILGTIL